MRVSCIAAYIEIPNFFITRSACFQDWKAKADPWQRLKTLAARRSHDESVQSGGISRDTIYPCGRVRKDRTTGRVRFIVPAVDVVPRGIRLRFNEHANDRGGARGVQRGPTFASTCFPRVSFARYCKTSREEETRFHFGQLVSPRRVASRRVASRAVQFRCCCSTLLLSHIPRVLLLLILSYFFLRCFTL